MKEDVQTVVYLLIIRKNIFRIIIITVMFNMNTYTRIHNELDEKRSFCQCNLHSTS